MSLRVSPNVSYASSLFDGLSSSTNSFKILYDFLSSRVSFLTQVADQALWPIAFSVAHLTLPGSRFSISTAIRLLKARERIGITGWYLQMNSKVLVLAAPASALIIRLFF